MPSSTTNYGWSKPTVGGDSTSWGTELNSSLDGIDSTVHSVSVTATAALPSATYTPADILTKIKTVDGAGSGLDADLFDGADSNYFTNVSNMATGTLNNNLLSPTVLRNITSGQNSGRITVSTAAPTGGSAGDIWLQYT